MGRTSRLARSGRDNIDAKNQKGKELTKGHSLKRGPLEKINARCLRILSELAEGLEDFGLGFKLIGQIVNKFRINNKFFNI